MHRTPAMAGGAFRSSALPRKPAVMFRPLPLLLSALLLLGAADAAWAQQGRGRGGPPPRGPERAQREVRDSLSDSIRRAERDTRGQVLGAERVPFDGREMHRVKVLDDQGRVRVYMEDPRDRREQRQDRRQDQRDGRDRGPRRPTRRDDD